MKIWTITTDTDAGTKTAIFYSAAAADSAAVAIVTDWYDKHLRGDDEPRDHTDWRETYELVHDTVGFMDSLTFEEHDISAHPAIASAHHAFDAMQEQICDSHAAACNDETVALLWEGKRNLAAAIGAADANQSQLWTVIFMLPHHWREDQPCAADEVIRVWTAADSADAAPDAARAILHTQTELGDTSPDLFATVAVYPGHVFDHFQP